MAVMITIIDAKELGLLVNTSSKMIDIEYKGYTMQALPSCKWCKVQAPSCMNLGKTLITLGPWLGKDYHRENVHSCLCPWYK